MRKMRRRKIVELKLNKFYKDYHKREFVEPDPLQYLYHFKNFHDREIVAIIAASLALGRVNSILSAIDWVLSRLPFPFENLLAWNHSEISERFRGFSYRFYRDKDLIDFLIALKETIMKEGSLNKAFLKGYKNSDPTILPALITFRESLSRRTPLKMIADPSKNSACKRLMLFLRWMVRYDNIDPGGWKGVSPSQLIIPLDTHMLQAATIMKLTDRKSSSMKTAIQITETLKKYDAKDPVRFDFSLTRPGINPNLDYSLFKN